jgi:hypothetical protein
MPELQLAAGGLLVSNEYASDAHRIARGGQSIVRVAPGEVAVDLDSHLGHLLKHGPHFVADRLRHAVAQQLRMAAASQGGRLATLPAIQKLVTVGEPVVIAFAGRGLLELMGTVEPILCCRLAQCVLDDTGAEVFEVEANHDRPALLAAQRGPRPKAMLRGACNGRPQSTQRAGPFRTSSIHTMRRARWASLPSGCWRVKMATTIDRFQRADVGASGGVCGGHRLAVFKIKFGSLGVS